FFQAEDGIRDFHVTGVQTCALPILERRMAAAVMALARKRTASECIGRRSLSAPRERALQTTDRKKNREGFVHVRRMTGDATSRQIGRASCRERVEKQEADITVKTME